MSSRDLIKAANGAREIDMSSAAPAVTSPSDAQRLMAAYRAGQAGAPWPSNDPAGEWFGPGVPIAPVAPPEVAGRTWDFPAGYNFQNTPRPYEPITCADLRALAQNLDIARIVITTRKDQMEKLNWSIVGKTLPDGTPVGEPNKQAQVEISTLLERPDGEHDWGPWLRILLEDLFVIDAPTVYCRRTYGGQLLGLRPLDGAGIKRIIDEWGVTPEPPFPAYQHIMHGVPAVDYTTDDVIWMPRNPRSYKSFGLSPVEEILTTVNIALRKQLFTLDWFTEGNLPQALLGTPNDWNAEQISRFQKYFDAMLAGNLEQRRHALFVPETMATTFKQMKEPELTGKFDEWIARVVCFAFSISPQPFISMMNRACHSSDTETLTERGWKLFKDIREDDRIATVNPDTGMMEYHVPTGRYVYPYSGEMVRFHTKCTDVLVTPEHKMWLRPGHDGAAYRKVEAQGVPECQVYFQAAVDYSGGPDRKTYELEALGRSDARTVNADDWLELVGYFASEGGLSTRKGHYLFTLAQKVGPKADRIQAALERLGISFSEYPRLDKGIRRWNVYGKQICDWMRHNVGERCHTKRLPREMLGLCPRQLRILFDAIMLGDGTVDSRDGRTARAYHSTSKGLADDVQELALKLGYSAKVTKHYEASGKRHEAYRVLICDRKEYSILNTVHDRTPASVSREPYDGYVYCFEVPNHLFVTRRNGCVSIHGNTAETAKEAALEEGLYPVMNWTKRFIDRVIQKFWPGSNLEFKWQDDTQVDKAEQATILTGYVTKGVMRINEARDTLGLDPVEGGDEIRVLTGTGFVKIDVNDDAPTAGEQAQTKADQADAQAKALASKPAAAPGAPAAQGQAPAPEGKEAPAAKAASPFRKRATRHTITSQDYWTKNATHRHVARHAGGATRGAAASP